MGPDRLLEMGAEAMGESVFYEALLLPEFGDQQTCETERAEALLACARHGEILFQDEGGHTFITNARILLSSKTGRHDDAIGLAAITHDNAQSWDSAIALANAYRRGDFLEPAADTFAQAGLDPTDVTAWLDVGDIRMGQEKYDRGLTAYERALAIEPKHPWGQPSAFFCRHKLNQEGDWLGSLQELANQEGCTCGLADCLTQMFGGYSSDDAINRARELLAEL